MQPPVTQHRRHDIDALRALAFALLILYHGCMLYVAGEDWGWPDLSCFCCWDF